MTEAKSKHTVRVSVVLTPDERDALRTRAHMLRTPVSVLVRDTLRRVGYLEPLEDNDAPQVAPPSIEPLRVETEIGDA